MKKRLFIFSFLLITASLTTYGFINWDFHSTTNTKNTNDSTKSSPKDLFNSNFIKTIVPETNDDMFFAIGSRYNNKLSRAELLKAKSIKNFLSNDSSKEISSYTDGQLILLKEGEEEIILKEYNGVLSENQLKLIQSLDYSTNFYAEAFCEVINKNNGKMIESQVVKYITTIPENEAAFKGGTEALIYFLKKSSKEVTSQFNREDLKAGRIHFTVSPEGKVINVKLLSSSDQKVLDEKMLQLIQNMPNNWTAATDLYGKKVAQELVFFYGGNMGC